MSRSPNADASEDVEGDAADYREHVADIVNQMMYVSGETGEPSAETTGMIEEIVRQQVIEIVSKPVAFRYTQTSTLLHRLLLHPLSSPLRVCHLVANICFAIISCVAVLSLPLVVDHGPSPSMT